MRGASFINSRKESLFARQHGNEAVSVFIMTLRFPKNEFILASFHALNMSKSYRKGQKRMDAVVMDCTSIGILGKLPDFKRITTHLSTISRVPDHAYAYASKIHRLPDDSCTSFEYSESFLCPFGKEVMGNEERSLSYVFRFRKRATN